MFPWFVYLVFGLEYAQVRTVKCYILLEPSYGYSGMVYVRCSLSELFRAIYTLLTLKHSVQGSQSVSYHARVGLACFHTRGLDLKPNIRYEYHPLHTPSIENKRYNVWSVHNYML